MPIRVASTKQAFSTAALVRQMVEQAGSLDGESEIVQAAVCAAPILAVSTPNSSEAVDWLNSQLAPWERQALKQAELLSTQYSVLRLGNLGEVSHTYELFLRHHSGSSRKRHGVYFTPPPMADYIVAGIDRILSDDFSLARGLADEQACIIDPACGTGVFLLAVIEHLRRNRLADRIPGLLRRMTGIEILPVAALVAKLNLALALAAMDVHFDSLDVINIIAGDALCPSTQSKIQNQDSKIPVFLGNPPFSSLSTNTNDWIARLVRGDEEVRGYVRANGQRLQERKTWLHDDYVKFIRLAQWHVEEAGCGVVAFVTNHGYLDNATFRLMRHELLRVFPRVEIVDLHGNRKKHEAAPNGQRDENVFGLDQGVAISLLSRPPTPIRGTNNSHQCNSIDYAELWGSRATKLAVLSNGALATEVCVSPQAPDWRFVPGSTGRTHPEYDAAWSLTDAMPIHTTAPVTARDHFLVAFTVSELKQRIEQFRDLSIPDDQIRQRYFSRTRSSRYETGDTRGWKLAEARRIIAADDEWQQKIIRCLYRPFDWRYVFWHPAMVDWPRTEITQRLIGDEYGARNVECGISDDSSFSALCVIARRQQLPTQPCTFFWVSDGLALDGVIRSDNRGSESLFPLYFRDEGGLAAANFAYDFVELFTSAIQLAWQPVGSGDLAANFGPEDLLAYIYSLFFSPTYRERHADELRSGFPRVLAPHDLQLFKNMCRLGRELINLHLLRTPHSTFRTPHGREAVVAFRAGGYIALKKWLQPKHRSEFDPEYTRIASAISRTIEIMDEIDAAMDERGVWSQVLGSRI